MAALSSVVLSFFAALSCLLGLNASSILNNCHIQCRAEEELKASCKAERNCESLLPNFDAFLRCLEPCSDIGSNCFQRCAFKTDEIAAACLRQCQMTGPAADISSDVDVSRAGQAGSEGHVSSGTLCYRSCYDNMLNTAMNRLYRKRPVEN